MPGGFIWTFLSSCILYTMFPYYLAYKLDFFCLAVLTTLGCSMSYFHVCRRVISLDVRINSFLYQTFLQLSFSQLAPHCRLIATFSKFISPVQVADVFNQNLPQKWQEGVNQRLKNSFKVRAKMNSSLTCTADVLTSNFLKMAKASSKSSLLMAMLAMSGAS